MDFLNVSCEQGLSVVELRGKLMMMMWWRMGVGIVGLQVVRVNVWGVVLGREGGPMGKAGGMGR
jgi:hypothetical protein